MLNQPVSRRRPRLTTALLSTSHPRWQNGIVDRQPRAIGDVRLRQRHRADRHGDPTLGPGDADRVAPHRAGQAATERLYRELKRPTARRTAQ